MQGYTVVFLLDKEPPTKVVLLRRAHFKKFAPGWHTGIGGKQEDGESIITTAYRELKEETAIDNVELHEFSRAIITNSQNIIHYYWAIYPQVYLPECGEGDLEWVKMDKVLAKNIIPTTEKIYAEWQNRHFALDLPWTLYMHRVDKDDDINLDQIVDRIVEGLEN